MSTPKSLFIQVAWNDPVKLTQQLEHVRRFHKFPHSTDYIYNVVLNEIGTKGGTLFTDILDVIVPYLPGGSTPAFDNVFVGSAIPRGVADAYGYAMGSDSYRWKGLRMQRTLWENFKVRYPNVDWHFYIDHEGVLDYFDIPSIRAGYEAYLLQSIRDAHALLPNRSVLWSPAVWSGIELSWWERREIKRTFRGLLDRARSEGWKGGFWLHLQDMMGRGRSDVTQEDVYGWYRQLEAMKVFDSLRVNMEMFDTRPGFFGPAGAYEVAVREAYYAKKGVPIGASWEMRHWFANHGEAA